MNVDPQHTGDSLRIRLTTTTYSDGTKLLVKEETKVSGKAGSPVINTPAKVTRSVTLDSHSFWILIGLVFIQVFYVTMIYGPIAAFLVEMFPVRIRYTSMSLPYHIGNGIFGGLLPAIATFLVSKATQANEVAQQSGTQQPYVQPYLEGLWYPILIASVSFVIGAVYINGEDNRIED